MKSIYYLPFSDYKSRFEIANTPSSISNGRTQNKISIMIINSSQCTIITNERPLTYSTTPSAEYGADIQYYKLSHKKYFFYEIAK